MYTRYGTEMKAGMSDGSRTMVSALMKCYSESTKCEALPRFPVTQRL